MKQLCLPIVESIIQEKGRKELLSRLSDPYWFQSFGAVIGMDWNSSGVTTAIMAAMKASLNPYAKDLGIYICGGKGTNSLKTHAELIKISDETGLDGSYLVRCSKLSAKVDNTALQDGFNLYLHSFILSTEGDWTIIQQGMQPTSGLARRYHWHSGAIKSFVEEPHTAVCGENQGAILNLTDAAARSTQHGIMKIAHENPEKVLTEIPYMKLPTYDDVRKTDLDLKRLGSVLWLAHEQDTDNFEEFLLLKGLGPRTLQSLTLVSEVIHGTPSRFNDPARFSFAHGGKNGTPFPVPIKVYDETIHVLKDAVNQARLHQTDKANAIKSLTRIAQKFEEGFVPRNNLEDLINKEKMLSAQFGGRSVTKKSTKKGGNQLLLFK